MSVSLTEIQVEKFRALGKAARALGNDYKEGKGPDPVSGSTYSKGVPQCTWGQLLNKAGFKPQGLSSGSNMGCFSQYIGEPKVASVGKVQGVKSGLFSDKTVDYDISKLKTYGDSIMHANDPAPTAAARKAGTFPLLLQLADEIDRVFGEATPEFTSFEQAAEQHLQELLMGYE